MIYYTGRLRKASQSLKKKFEKSFKKVLTSRAVGDIIYKLSARQRSSLKIEQQDNAISFNKEVDKTPKNSFEFIWTLIISKEPKTALKLMLSGETRLIYNFSESLILAQDERWRRA